MSLLRALAGFVAGLVAGYAAAIGVYILYIQVTGTVDREGAMAMGVAFLIGPAVALACGVIGALVFGRRRHDPAGTAGTAGGGTG